METTLCQKIEASLQLNKSLEKLRKKPKKIVKIKLHKLFNRNAYDKLKRNMRERKAPCGV